MRVLLLLALTCSFLYCQDPNPKREFRGSWIAVVRNEDWPSKPGLSVQDQKRELLEILNILQESNINAVFFQVRPECDALYDSPFEPWSYWLTGTQGKAPNPYYDPLNFAIEEAHKRGMELHAWFNPYRAVGDTEKYEVSEDHISETETDKIIQIGTYKFLDPGLPSSREYITKIIMDVVKRYDVDGIHLDDYFYPYPAHGITDEDSETFSEYSRGFTDIGDWRRDNVNILIQSLKDTILSEKPYLKFGVSPFGIYKNGVPEGIVGLDAYNEIYCDPVAWMESNSVDYLIPQLYWPFGGQQDFDKLLNWWSDNSNGVHIYAGLAYYKAYGSSEYNNQIQLSRDINESKGVSFFKSTNFLDNFNSVTDSLKSNKFRNKALVPIMEWKDQPVPAKPVNLSFGKLNNERGYGLKWEYTDAADSAFMFAVYSFPDSNIHNYDLNNPKYLAELSGTNYTWIKELEEKDSVQYFAVSSLGRNYNESELSEVLKVQFIAPEVPKLSEPNNEAINQRDTVNLIWNTSAYSNYNTLQVSTDSNFNDIIFEKENIRDTSQKITNLQGQMDYYWRVKAVNMFGESSFSDVWKFTTGFPVPPSLSKPNDKTSNIDRKPRFVWNPSEVATYYSLQVALGSNFSESQLVLDTIVTDTLCQLQKMLDGSRIFSWRVGSGNDYGFGGYSGIFRFKTGNITDVNDLETIVSDYKLYQNYPNPFNPTTKIKFDLPEASQVSLIIYDVLGNEVIKLINGKKLKSGRYTRSFNAGRISSGVYFYQIITEKFSKTKKLILLK